MEVNTTPSAARGEVAITIAGQQYPVRFGMNVMRDFSKLTGRAPSEFLQLLADDYNEALSGLVYCAVRRYAPGACAGQPQAFSQDDAADLIDGLNSFEADALAEAIVEAVTVGNPMLASLTAKVVSKSRIAESTQARSCDIVATKDQVRWAIEGKSRIAESTQAESGTNSSTSLSVS